MGYGSYSRLPSLDFAHLTTSRQRVINSRPVTAQASAVRIDDYLLTLTPSPGS